MNKFTISFITGPERKNELYNAWSSLSDVNRQPEDIMVIFNPFVFKDHDIFLDMADFRNNNILKLNSFQNMSKCWNLSILLSNTKYNIIANDDLVFQDPDFLDKIEEKHEEGYPLVHATENWSCFSIDKELIRKIGWFEEKLPHSWEDIDYRYRMARADILDYRFEREPVKHTRSQSGRRDNTWDAASEYFFRKWDIEKYVAPNNPGIFDEPGKRRQLQSTGFFRHTDPKELNEALPTPNYHNL